LTGGQTRTEGGGTWTRLRRRKVVQYGLAYVAAAWALLQGIGFVADAFGWPAAVKQWATITLPIGLPVVLVIAWYHGDRGQQRASAPELGLIALLLLTGGGVLWFYGQRGEPTAAVVVATRVAVPAATPFAPPEKSIAVLPFVDMSEHKDQEYFSDGMSEEVLNLLTQIPQLRVIARTSSFSFKGKTVDVATIARTLNVAHVLEGSIRKSGDTVRITAQLIRASDSSHLWSETYDRKLTDVFRVQDEIAGAVVAALKLKLLPAQQVTSTHRTADPDAYNQYLLGNQFFNRSTPDGFRRAVTAYQQAVSLDPGFAAGYARLATAEAFASDYAETVAIRSAGRQRALAAADHAVSLAPDLADGYAERGFLRINWLWDWDGARADFVKALVLEPGNSQAQKGLGELLISLGRLPESVAEIKKAVQLDPLTASTWFDLGWVLMAGGQWQDAREALNRALEINPESSFGNYGLGCLELLQGRASVALISFRQAGAYWSLAGVAMAEHSLGHAGESQRVLNELIARYAQDAAYQIAEVYAWRGQRDQAFEWLERAYAQRDGGLSVIKADALLAPLRMDTRFTAMLKKLGLPP